MNSFKIKNVLLTGGTGLVGQALKELLIQHGYHVSILSRSLTKKDDKTFYWNPEKEEIEVEALKNTDAIIHLAGAGVISHRWTKSYKKKIYDSRVLATSFLRESVVKHRPKLSFFLAASAIGYYGLDTREQLLAEDSPSREEFLADLVKDWEEESGKFQAFDIPVGIVRIGLVLSKKGGILHSLITPFKVGLGSPIGTGKQYMSWIHIDDLCRMFLFMLDNKSQTVVNGVASYPVTNFEFCKLLAQSLGRRMILPSVPVLLLKWVLGERAKLLLGGNRVSNKKINDLGFKFKYHQLEQALENLVEPKGRK